MNWFSIKNNSVVLNVYVVPRSSKSEVIGIYNDCLKIKLKSPPVDNAANEELIRFLAKKLNIPKSNIKIIRGLRQKKKIISVDSCRLTDCRRYLMALE